MFSSCNSSWKDDESFFSLFCSITDSIKEQYKPEAVVLQWYLFKLKIQLLVALIVLQEIDSELSTWHLKDTGNVFKELKAGIFHCCASEEEGFSIFQVENNI